jgi:Uma2 family endonuclease
MATTIPSTALDRGSAGAEQRIALYDIDWATYQRIATGSGRRRILLAYNRGVLEIMSPSALHEGYKMRLHDLIATVAKVLGIHYMAFASTTWDRPTAERGIEADGCYLFVNEKLAVAKPRPGDVAARIAPDLAIEIDLRPPVVDRAQIYATLGVPEVWRFNGTDLAIDRLVPPGTYEPASESQFLPLSPSEIVPWLVTVEVDDLAWYEQLEAWVRAEILPKQRG